MTPGAKQPGDPPAFRPGQRLTVVDASPVARPGGKALRPPFVVGETVECLSAGPASVLLKGDPRLWKLARFVAAS